MATTKAAPAKKAVAKKTVEKKDKKILRMWMRFKKK